jgi:hypothetical protein
MLYRVRILVHGYGENGRNPEFDFVRLGDAFGFINICFDNGYDVEVGKIKPSDK